MAKYEAVFYLTSKDVGLSDALKKAKEQVGSLSKEIDIMNKLGAKSAEMFSKSITWLWGSMMDAMYKAKEISILAKRMGMPAEEVAKLSRYAETLGVNIGSLGRAMVLLSKQASGALDGTNKKAVELSKSLGLSHEQLKKIAKGGIDGIILLKQAMEKAGMSTANQKAAFTGIFGRRAFELEPMLQKSSSELQKEYLSSTAMNSTTISSLLRIQKAYSAVMNDFAVGAGTLGGSLEQVAGVALLLSVALLEMLESAVQFAKWVQDKTGIGEPTSKTGGAITGAVKGFGAGMVLTALTKGAVRAGGYMLRTFPAIAERMGIEEIVAPEIMPAVIALTLLGGASGYSKEAAEEEKRQRELGLYNAGQGTLQNMDFSREGRIKAEIVKRRAEIEAKRQQDQKAHFKDLRKKAYGMMGLVVPDDDDLAKQVRAEFDEADKSPLKRLRDAAKVTRDEIAKEQDADARAHGSPEEKLAFKRAELEIADATLQKARETAKENYLIDSNWIRAAETKRKLQNEYYQMQKKINDELESEWKNVDSSIDGINELAHNMREYEIKHGFGGSAEMRGERIRSETQKRDNLRGRYDRIMGTATASDQDKRAAFLALQRQEFELLKAVGDTPHSIATGSGMRAIGGGGTVAPQALAMVDYARDTAKEVRRMRELLEKQAEDIQYPIRTKEWEARFGNTSLE